MYEIYVRQAIGAGFLATSSRVKSRLLKISETIRAANVKVVRTDNAQPREALAPRHARSVVQPQMRRLLSLAQAGAAQCRIGATRRGFFRSGG